MTIKLPMPNVSLEMPIALVFFFVGAFVICSLVQVADARGEPPYGWGLMVAFSGTAVLLMYTILVVLSE